MEARETAAEDSRSGLSRRAFFFGCTLAGVAAGAAAWLIAPVWAAWLWNLTTAGAVVPLAILVALKLRRRELGVDIVALLAMGGALALGEPLAGAVIALMIATGQALEEFAGARARAEMSALLDRIPRSVHRYENGRLAVTPIEEVAPGDRLMVRPGEVVPVDGHVAGSAAVLDESPLTGESIPVSRGEGELARSGTINAGGPFELLAVSTAGDGTYAALVRLVRQAQSSKSPFVRLADRYALWFVPVTLACAALAWMASGDANRALAVLVVATPCPMILAAPVAIVAGLSRCAKRGIIVKGGAALEALAGARILVLDKTGTITHGAMDVSEVMGFGSQPPEELLRLAASLEQASPHVLASAVVSGARRRGLRLAIPEDVHESIGQGIRGTVEGREVAVGRHAWVAMGLPPPPPALAMRRVEGRAAAMLRARRRATIEGSAVVTVAIDGAIAGALILDDPIRVDASMTLRALRRSGIERIVLLTGDHLHVAEAIGAGIGADEVLAERSAEEKVQAVRSERARGPTVMVGDGINDAAALAAADVGVALAARGATASSQAADVVLMVDRLDRLAEALRAARRSRRIARQSVLAGMGMSFAAMGLAAAGFIPPVAGALLQEGIDVAVIFNALRALRGDRRRGASLGAARTAELQREHRRLLPDIDRLRSLADRLDLMAPAAAIAELRAVRAFLDDQLVPHEKDDEAVLYPIVAELIGGNDPTAAMSRAHLEIAHLTRLYGSLVDEMGGELGGEPGGDEIAPQIFEMEDLRDLRRILYSLHAVLKLHFAQEDEHYLTLLEQRSEEEPAAAPRRT